MTPTLASLPDSSAQTGVLPTTGLLLTGGGARAAYQVGVLEAIAHIRRVCGQGQAPNPFPIITGTSAGAINAAALACGADHFDLTVRQMAHVWSHLHTESVYRADALSVLRSGARWLSLLSPGWALTRWRTLRPRSLLDNAPLGRAAADRSGAARSAARSDCRRASACAVRHGIELHLGGACEFL